MTIYYFIYTNLTNGLTYKEGSFNKEFITNMRDELAKKYNIDPKTMPIFEEK